MPVRVAHRHRLRVSDTFAFAEGIIHYVSMGMLIARFM